MLTLAQRVFDTAHNIQVNARQNSRNPKGGGGLHRNFAEKAERSESKLSSEPFFSHFEGILDIADELSGAMKFSIDQAVADAVVKMEKTPFKTLFEAFSFAKLPYPKTWIEFCLPEGDLNIGWLLEQEEDGIAIRYVQSHSRTNHTAHHEPSAHYFINSEGIYFHADSATARPEYSSQQDVDRDLRFLNYIARSTLSLLLLLNSRSKIILIDPAEQNVNRTNKRRKKRGDSEIATISTLNKLRFDVARVIKKNDNLTSEEMAERMAASLVRGHFKVRKTGVFFWSPYVRGGIESEEKAVAQENGLDRERAATKTGLAGPPTLNLNV